MEAYLHFLFVLFEGTTVQVKHRLSKLQKKNQEKKNKKTQNNSLHMYLYIHVRLG